MRGTMLGIVLILLLARNPENSRADVLRFIEGGEIDVPISIEGTVVVIDTPMGKLRFPRTDFAQIEATLDPTRDWPDRRVKALQGGASECFAAALWALDFGLLSESEIMLRETLAVDPEHKVAGRMVSVLDRLRVALPDPDLAPLLRGSPPGHRISRGPHTLLIHQHPEPEATERISILERVITAYYLYFASIGLDLAMPQQRFPSIWFARKSEYLAYLRSEGADAFLTTRGYHHPTRGLVATYDCRDDPARIKTRDELFVRHHELDQFSRQINNLQPNARVRVSLKGTPSRELSREKALTLQSDLRHQVDRQDLVMELSRREIDWGVAAHETIHQLVAVSHLAPRHDAFPNWLHEGLAMQFETIRGGCWAGLGSPSPLRLRDYRRLTMPPALIPTSRDVGFGRGYQADTYARAWSLVFYLRVHRPPAFLSLLDGLRLPPAGTETSPIRSSRLLLDSLSPDLAAEESRWRRCTESLLPIAGARSMPEHPH